MAIYVREYGSVDAPTIVFLHGGGWSGWMWDKHVTFFQEYHCLIPDLPEHGRSAEVKPFSIQSAADEIIELIYTKTKNGKAHVVGFSLGAQIATEILSRDSSVADHVVICSALVRKMPYADIFLKLFQVYYCLTRNKRFHLSQARKYNISYEHFPIYYEDVTKFKGKMLKRILTENFNHGLPIGLDKVEVPTLILVGETEPSIMLNSARDLVTTIPQAKGYIIKGARHTYSYECSFQFSKLIHEWINGNDFSHEFLLPII